MIRKILIFFVFVFMSVSFYAQSIIDGNNAYSEGEFDKALSIYVSLIDSGLESTALYFNTANTYYKKGDLAHSLLFYERAKLLAPADKDIQFNLDLTRKLVVDKIELVDELFIKAWFRGFRNTLSTDAWAWISIATFLLFIVGLFGYALLKSTGGRKTGFYIAMLAVFLSILSGVFSYQQKQILTIRNNAIIFSPSVTVKSSPDKSGTELFILHEGSKVSVRDSVGNWWEIVMGDGNVGWIPNNTLKKI